MDRQCVKLAIYARGNEMKLFEKNIGNTDRMVRFALALVFVGAGVFLLQEPLNYIAYLLALVMIFTGATRSCGAYTLIGINTLEKKPSKK